MKCIPCQYALLCLNCNNYSHEKSAKKNRFRVGARAASSDFLGRVMIMIIIIADSYHIYYYYTVCRAALYTSARRGNSFLLVIRVTFNLHFHGGTSLRGTYAVYSSKKHETRAKRYRSAHINFYVSESKTS
jgi:hypothetical protein